MSTENLTIEQNTQLTTLAQRVAAIEYRLENYKKLQEEEKALKASTQNLDAVPADSTFAFGTHVFDMDSYRLYDNDSLVECTPAELRLLREFIRNYGIVITRNQLMERLYDTENTFIDDNTLSVYVKRLRDKLGDDARFITTVKGVGYRFE